VKIGLEEIDMQKGITVEVLLDSRVTGLVISSEFARKQEFKLEKIKRLIYVRNVDNIFNKEGLIEHIVGINKRYMLWYAWTLIFFPFYGLSIKGLA